jgi:transposase
MAEIEKKTKRYPTDLADEEWARIEPFLPGAAKSGRPARTDLREVLNASKANRSAISNAFTLQEERGSAKGRRPALRVTFYDAASAYGP